MPASQKPPVYYHISLCILAFALPFPFIYSSVSIALVSLAWLGQFSLVKTKQRFLERRALLGWFLFFALLVLSFFISADKEEALIDLQKKLSLIILPVVIGLGPQLDRRWLNRIFTSFVVGLCLIGLFCMGRGLLFFVQSGDTEMLFYHSLVRGLDINAVYYSSYLIFALSILLLHHFEHSVFRDTRLKYVALAILMVFFHIAILQISIGSFYCIRLTDSLLPKAKKGAYQQEAGTGNCRAGCTGYNLCCSK